MSFARLVSVAFKLLGAMLCLLAIIAGGIAVATLADRMQRGRGIMFADVEFFAVTTLALLVPGLALLFVAGRISRRLSDRKPEDFG